jgi:phage-related protein (TIGR01555 family)
MGSETIYTGRSSRLEKLEHEARLLTLNNEAMRQSQRLQKMQLQNSLTSLVQGVIGQTTLTSFNPMITNNIMAPLTINWTLLSYFYKTHGVIQTAIDMPVLDAFRGGVDIKSDEGELDEENVKEIHDEIEEQDIISVWTDTGIWTRLFGGGAIVINTGEDPATPLDLNRPIRHLELYSAARWELQAPSRIASTGGDELHTNRLNPWEQYASAMTDYYVFYGTKIHNSRVMSITGKAAPFLIRWQLQGWGMSEIERMVEDFNIYIRTRNVLYDILNEAKVDVYHLEGLKESLASDESTAIIQQRIQNTNSLKNFNNALLLDKEDDYETKQLQFGGLAEIMKENRIGIASALRMPISKLFGIASTGMSSGEDDIENYNAMVESEVRQRMRRVVRKTIDLICLYKFGATFQFHWDYKPLRVMSTLEEEDVKLKKHQRIMDMYDRALMDSEEVGIAENRASLIEIETKAAQGKLEDFPAPAGAEAQTEMETASQKELIKAQPRPKGGE